MASMETVHRRILLDDSHLCRLLRHLVRVLTQNHHQRPATPCIQCSGHGKLDRARSELDSLAQELCKDDPMAAAGNPLPAA